MNELPTTRRGLAATGNGSGSETGISRTVQYPLNCAGRNVCREGRIATVPVFDNSARGAYVGAQASNRGDGRGRALSAKTGYVPTEEYRQVPSPIDFPCHDGRRKRPGTGRGI